MNIDARKLAISAPPLISTTRINAMKTRVLLSCMAVTLPVALSPVLAISASTNPTVTVVNTTSNPVPVVGTVTLGNAVLPVEVSNADPIPVAVMGAVNPAPRKLGAASLDLNGHSGVIFTVPAGKRIVLTDIVATARPSAGSPNINLINECVLNVNTDFKINFFLEELAGGFMASQHFTTGIVFTAGQCLRLVNDVDENIYVSWYEESAS